VTSVRSRGDGFTLSFDGSRDVDADFLILTLPFSVLRHVDMAVELPSVKKRAIQELGYGTNSKLILGFNKPVWRAAGFGGYVFNNTIQNGWDNSQMQNRNLGASGFTVFLGGSAGRAMAEEKSS